MTAARDRLAQAEAELAAAEAMGVNTDPAQAAVEAAEQEVADEYVCAGCPYGLLACDNNEACLR